MVCEFSCKLVVHALREHELHTLETFIIRFWAHRGSVTMAPKFPASNNILSDAICSCYCHPIDRGDTLVELYIRGRPVAHGC